MLFVAEMQGLYFLSSVLLIRNSLPDRYRGFIDEAMGADNLSSPLPELLRLDLLDL